MSFLSKKLESEYELFDKINKNLNQYILELNSQTKNSIIKSKLTEKKPETEIFNCYDNKNALQLFELLDKIDNMYSKFYTKISNNIMPLKDKFISELSNVILAFNLLSKNQQIIRKHISNIDCFLQNFYFENHINKDSKNKINDYIDSLINSKKKKKKKISSLIANDNIFKRYNKSNRFKSVKANPNFLTLNRNPDEKNAKMIKVNHAINNLNKKIANNSCDKFLNEEKLINDLATPKFHCINFDDNFYNDLNIYENYNSTQKTIIKQQSINSFYTLASKAEYITPDENNNQKLQKGENEKKEKDEYNKIFKNKQNDLDKSLEPQLIYCKSNNSYGEKREENNQNLEERTFPNPRKQVFSSLNLKSSMEKEMFKNFLMFINSLHKNGSINSEEKIKLKQLVVSKSEKIEKIYNIFYKVNKNQFLNELKKLIV